MSIPLSYKPYLNKENCIRRNKNFTGKSDIALDFISSFEKPCNWLVRFIYRQAKNNISIEVVLSELKLASKKSCKLFIR